MDGDDTYRQALCTHLAASGNEVHGIGLGADLDVVLTRLSIDVALCNIHLPDETGFSVAARLRMLSSAGLVLLAETERREDRILALSLGVDHYVTRSGDFHELEMLVANLHRRLNGPPVDARTPLPDPRTPAGAWLFDAARWTLTAPEGAVITLSLAEHILVSALIARVGDVVPREELLAALDRGEVRLFSRNVDMIVSRLRKKVAQVSSERLPVLSARGIGYVFTGVAVTS
ncbi:MAG TPA: winged helix-turn-helix domain-containing protein [Fontimonas sp.]